MMQMLIFFLLGLLVFPSKLPYYFVPALFIAIFLTFIARPITMAILLSPFKSPLNQQLIMSWAGLRGAASIVLRLSLSYHQIMLMTQFFHRLLYRTFIFIIPRCFIAICFKTSKYD